MTGICGWHGACDGEPDVVINAMRGRIGWAGPPAQMSLADDRFGLAAVGPANTVGVFAHGAVRLAFHGHGYWRDRPSRALTPAVLCERFVELYRDRGAEALALLGGDFSLAIIDLDKRALLFAVDRAGVRNLVYRQERGIVVFAANLDALAVHPAVSQRIDPQALYNYVHFHMVPGPGTIFERSSRVLPGHYVQAQTGNVATRPYWRMEFRDDPRPDLPALERDFRAVVRAGVDGFALPQSCATFLSGGTDSSTVTGMLGCVAGTPVAAYSIGFEASGYDEMAYARIAATHFRADHHAYYVTPADVVAAIPLLAAEYDQPFGNASAIPTYYCAKLARADGIERMLAGDGGDELFGGNARYAKQRLLSRYGCIPQWLRTQVLEPLLRAPFASSIPLLRKGRSYVEQARLPMPARYETYNLLERLGPQNVFAPEFLAGVDRERPLELLADAWRTSEGANEINRMLALDLKFTLADNDLPKVTRMCDAAGIDVAFPLLHDDVVAFSAILPADLKLRGTKLRYFFKKALRGFLPAEVIAKEKHGFGLPTGPWLAGHMPLNDLARQSMASLARRGIFRPQFLAELVDARMREHAGYYGTMLWILMMLELWFQQHDTGKADPSLRS